MSFIEKAGKFFNPKEIGKITESEAATLTKAAELLRRADGVWLRWSELNEAADKIPEDRVDPETRKIIDDLLLTLHEQLKKINLGTVDPGLLNELRLVQARNRAVTEEAEDKDRPDYFSAEDLAVSTQVGWAKRVVAEGGEKERRDKRLAAARTLEKVITEKKLIAADDQLLVIECAVTLASAKLVGPLPQLAAERCDRAWRNYLSDPTPVRLGKLKQVYEKLQQALDVAGLVRRADERAEEFESSLKEKIARQALLANDLLSISYRKDNTSLEQARARVENAAQAVQATLGATLKTLAQKLAILRGALQVKSDSDREQDETAFAAVSAIFDNGNLEQQLWVQPCANAMKELAQAMEILSKLLNVKAPVLPEHEANRALPAPEIVDAELVDYDNIINAEYARELGLVKKELRAFPEADRLIREIVEKKLNPNTDAGKKRLCEEWPADCPPPFVPLPDYWNKFYPGQRYPEWFAEDRSRIKQWSFVNVQRLFAGTIISNLTGNKNKPLTPHYNQEAVFMTDRADEDWDATENGKKKLQTEGYSDKLLNAILAEAGKPPHVGCVNIPREEIDNVLWKGDPGDRTPSFAALGRYPKRRTPCPNNLGRSALV